MGGFIDDVGGQLLDKLASGFSATEKLAPEWGPRLTGLIRNYKEEEEKIVGSGFNKMVEAIKPAAQYGSDTLQKHMENLKPSTEPAVQLAGFKANKLLGDTQTEFERRGLADPNNRMSNYWPRRYPKEAFEKHKMQNLLQSLVSSGKAKNLNEAQRMLEFMKSGGVKASHFEIPRKFNIPGYRTDLSVLPETYAEGLRRLTSVKWFGPKDELLNKILLNIQDETHNKQTTDYIRGVTQHFLGRPVLDAPEETGLPTRTLDKAVASTEAALHLSLAVTSHANKFMNLMLLHGITPLVKSVAEIAHDYGSAREFSIQSGSLLTQAMAEFKNEYGPEEGNFVTNAGSKLLHLQGFYKVDKFFRILGSTAGKIAAQDYARQLLKDSDNTFAQYRLKMLGIDPAEVLRVGGLTRDMELQAAKRTSDVTQFRNDVSTLPDSWRRSSMGRMTSMFKSFYFQQAKFMKDFVVKPAIDHHDFRPLAYLMIVAPFAAEPFADLRSLVRGDYSKRPGFNHPLDRAVDSMVQGGVFGMYYELAQGVSSPSDTFMWRFLFNNLAPLPAASAAGALVTMNHDLHTKDPKIALERSVIKRLLYDTPFVGPYAERHFFPAKKPYVGPLSQGVLTKGAKALLGGM